MKPSQKREGRIAVKEGELPTWNGTRTEHLQVSERSKSALFFPEVTSTSPSLSSANRNPTSDNCSHVSHKPFQILLRLQIHHRVAFCLPFNDSPATNVSWKKGNHKRRTKPLASPNLGHIVQDLLEVALAPDCIPPRGPHAEPRASCLFRPPSRSYDRIFRHQLLAFYSSAGRKSGRLIKSLIQLTSCESLSCPQDLMCKILVLATEMTTSSAGSEEQTLRMLPATKGFLS